MTTAFLYSPPWYYVFCGFIVHHDTMFPVDSLSTMILCFLWMICPPWYYVSCGWFVHHDTMFSGDSLSTMILCFLWIRCPPWYYVFCGFIVHHDTMLPVDDLFAQLVCFCIVDFFKWYIFSYCFWKQWQYWSCFPLFITSVLFFSLCNIIVSIVFWEVYLFNFVQFKHV